MTRYCVPRPRYEQPAQRPAARSLALAPSQKYRVLQ
jgi:hypothetical protein